MISTRLLAAFDANDVKIPHTSTAYGTLIHIMEIVFPIIGAIALLMVVIAGFRYTISSGEPAAIQKAKNQIIYSMIGLVIAIAGFVIVSFAIARLPS